MQLANRADSSPQVRQLRALYDAANGSAPVQRVVKLSEAPWGPTKGKWITTEASLVPHNSKVDAQKAEDAILEQREAAAEAAWQLQANSDAWTFKDAQKRLTTHYGDGWGAAYGITSHNQLRAYIQAHNTDNGEPGQYTISLGSFGNNKTHIFMACDIVYDVTGVVSVTSGALTRNAVAREVFHCGPESQDK